VSNNVLAYHIRLRLGTTMEPPLIETVRMRLHTAPRLFQCCALLRDGRQAPRGSELAEGGGARAGEVVGGARFPLRLYVDGIECLDAAERAAKRQHDGRAQPLCATGAAETRLVIRCQASHLRRPIPALRE